MITENIIQTDGCTGFPDSVGGHDLSQCCSIHDDGGTDGQLMDCVDAAVGGEWVWIVLAGIAIALMRVFRPVYNQLQKWGWLPKTKGSKF